MKDKQLISGVVQSFYDNIAEQYDRFYSDWNKAAKEEACFLSRLFYENGFDKTAKILDCACGIGTQAVGLAAMGYNVTASDISAKEIAEAEKRAAKNKVNIRFEQADFRKLADTFTDRFDIIIAIDNALPHMLTANDLGEAIRSIVNQLKDGGLFVASIRDYDSVLIDKPGYSPPYIHKTDRGQRVLFQTWDWFGEKYKLTQYIIEDDETARLSRFECEYRATRREEITNLLYDCGCVEVNWKMPSETGFYQPIVTAGR